MMCFYYVSLRENQTGSLCFFQNINLVFTENSMLDRRLEATLISYDNVLLIFPTVRLGYALQSKSLLWGRWFSLTLPYTSDKEG